MRYAILSLLLLPSVLTAQTQPFEGSNFFDYKPFESNSVQRSVCSIDTDAGFGTGVFIGDGKIVTAWHCIYGDPNAEGPKAKPSLIRASVFWLKWAKDLKVIKEDRASDLCLLEIIDGAEPDGFYRLSLAAREPQNGDSVQLLGLSCKSAVRHLEGKVFDDAGTKNQDVFDSRIPVAGGDSGGAIINAKGELVGIVSTGCYPNQVPLRHKCQIGDKIYCWSAPFYSTTQAVKLEFIRKLLK